MAFQISIEVEREDDGRWIADILEFPGVVAYGQTREEAIARAEAIAMRVIADRIEQQVSAEAVNLTFAIA